MNEQLQIALSELLNKANNGIDGASDFLVDELPDVIYQLLLWHGVYSAIISVLCIAALIVLYKASKTLSKKDSEFYDSPELIIILICCWLVVGVSVAVNFNLAWLQIWIAPKAWIIEYAAKLAG